MICAEAAVRTDLEGVRVRVATPAEVGRLTSPPTGAKRTRALGAMVAGLAIAAAAAVAVATSAQGAAGPRESVSIAHAGQGAADPTISVTDLTYDPGHSSGWHVHPGVHSVVVLSGTLTVYDEACRPQVYGPGESYLGGREPHLASNETAEPLKIVATSVYDRSAMGPGSSVAAPAGCEAR